MKEMNSHENLYADYRQGLVKCFVEPSLARQYYTDLSDQHRNEICGEAEPQTAIKIKGLMGVDSAILLIVVALSIFAFRYWAIGLIPLAWIYCMLMKGDASMGSRTFRWPFALCIFWWVVGVIFPFGGIPGKAFFFFLPLMYVFSLYAYRQASRAVMALAFRNERAFLWLTDNSKGKPVLLVKKLDE
jgi:hypothetical protein